MFRPYIAAAVFLYSTSAVLASVQAPNFGVMQKGEGHLATLESCMDDSWKSASPTDAQTQQADDFMAQAKEVLDAEEGGARESMKEMGAAWKKHPVSEAEVIGAESALQSHVAPVREAVRNATIHVLNLLSNEQRASFDEAMRSCLRRQRDDVPGEE